MDVSKSGVGRAGRPYERSIDSYLYQEILDLVRRDETKWQSVVVYERDGELQRLGNPMSRSDAEGLILNAAQSEELRAARFFIVMLWNESEAEPAPRLREYDRRGTGFPIVRRGYRPPPRTRASALAS